MADSTSPAVSPRFALRAATSEAHERLDARFSAFDLADANDYGAFLLAQAGAFFPVEDALEAAGVAKVMEDWPARRRSEALRADLAALGLSGPKSVAVPSLSSEADTLGALYVLEGSRLGGAMLVRTVPDTLPKTFLTPGNPAAWRAFVTVLDQRLSSQADLDAAAAAASSVFEAFATSASNVLGKDDT
jgi:heme oxygenase